MVLETVDELAKMREAGWRPDYYVMDAGCSTEKAITRLPQARLAERPSGDGGAINKLASSTAVVRRRRRDPRQPGRAAQQEARRQAVPGAGTVPLRVQEGADPQIEKLGLTMVKFDFATFDCTATGMATFRANTPPKCP